VEGGPGDDQEVWKKRGDFYYSLLIVTRYIRGNKRVVTADSPTQDGTDAKEAAKIESRVRQKMKPEAELLGDAMSGQRKLDYIGAELFCERLELRMPVDRDPGGNKPQAQSPAQVGCARSIMQRVSHHEPLDDMTGSSKALALTLSCMRAMGLEPQMIFLPIIKVWKAEQLEIAEIAITMLAGSLIAEGGHNAKQAGGQTLDEAPDSQKFKRALHQITRNAPWTKENLAESEEHLRKVRNGIQSSYAGFSREELALQQSAKTISGRVYRLHLACKSLARQFKSQASKYSNATELAEKLVLRIKSSIADSHNYARYQGNNTRWLKGIRQLPPIMWNHQKQVRESIVLLGRENDQVLRSKRAGLYNLIARDAEMDQISACIMDQPGETGLKRLFKAEDTQQAPPSDDVTVDSVHPASQQLRPIKSVTWNDPLTEIQYFGEE
jgi:hypothetical protein